ncbi:sulfite exporter TauE/SafE family protein [Angustibacter sp. Root456]|uniref:sulfite exporter TauE/SafE family protein n=1 Tax=Angustibacter sp. Root456 TaxID=1736539 RepID=UPI0009EB7076|nr:sulfite exporter TauE/SafE family protein [Angustibacter sp. Root456]
MAGLSPQGWALLAVGASFLGFSKTAVNGLSMVSVALFAAVLPVRLSTGTLLLLILVGDVYSVRAYQRHADWRVLRGLTPSVGVGILAGTWFVSAVDDTDLRRTIGAVMLTLAVVQTVARMAPRWRGSGSDRYQTPVLGGLSGFTSMVANAGGAFMSIYLLRAGVGVMSFIGTAAWFFFVVNLVKLPLSIMLGLVTVQSLYVLVALAPLVLAGGWLGRKIAPRLSPRVFEVLVMVFTVLGALNLLR